MCLGGRARKGAGTQIGERTLVAVHSKVPTSLLADLRQVSGPPRSSQHGIVVLSPPEDAGRDNNTNRKHARHDLNSIFFLVARVTHLVVEIRMVAGGAARRTDLKERPVDEADEVREWASTETHADCVCEAWKKIPPLENRAYLFPPAAVEVAEHVVDGRRHPWNVHVKDGYHVLRPRWRESGG